MPGWPLKELRKAADEMVMMLDDYSNAPTKEMVADLRRVHRAHGTQTEQAIEVVLALE